MTTFSTSPLGSAAPLSPNTSAAGVGALIPVRIARVPQNLVVGTRAAFLKEELAHVRAGVDLIIDFAGALYVDSSGLGVLMTLAGELRKLGRRLVCCALRPDLRLLFEITGMDKSVAVVDDEEAARAHLQTCLR